METGEERSNRMRGFRGRVAAKRARLARVSGQYYRSYP